MTVPVTFRITTYYKRKRNEAGLTQLASTRINMGQALDWLIAELPADAIRIGYSENREEVTFTINWSKVPAQIRTGSGA